MANTFDRAGESILSAICELSEKFPAAASWNTRRPTPVIAGCRRQGTNSHTATEGTGT
ncbi:hypothetical protein ACFOSC_13630 [Streptantibioticus rubrisoli]|uniref:Uncharacterized protein n=1 Tax=Streptantibioticus rubrisoli TaxID=1387313 RepID=A0ABT1PFN8_9ACTN|nr:hypothetical protein [Streptantibioticus rubrisoli]MCQ4043033.1 hypothetical protein [Streptantibioticus rubrisoli]